MTSSISQAVLCERDNGEDGVMEPERLCEWIMRSLKMNRLSRSHQDQPAPGGPPLLTPSATSRHHLGLQLSRFPLSVFLSSFGHES